MSHRLVINKNAPDETIRLLAPAKVSFVFGGYDAVSPRFHVVGRLLLDRFY